MVLLQISFVAERCSDRVVCGDVGWCCSKVQLRASLKMLGFLMPLWQFGVNSALKVTKNKNAVPRTVNGHLLSIVIVIVILCQCFVIDEPATKKTHVNLKLLRDCCDQWGVAKARNKRLLVFRSKLETRREIVCFSEGGLPCGGRVTIDNNTRGGRSFVLPCSCEQSWDLLFRKLTLVFLRDHVLGLSSPLPHVSFLPGLASGV